ncbi:hypothetical protein [Bacteroides cellulosilyticus]|jgi:hypothetical protein|uniref:hypothetical protein n=1 Tax=Bacteroides cellulosilyticus TaxID=246787 RepID=UPI00189741ED|nr:hypothetical protein [Bacteroides cellulosilyticus]
MEYKFQDVLKNIIPGFYILFGSFIICFFNGMSINKITIIMNIFPAEVYLLFIPLIIYILGYINDTIASFFEYNIYYNIYKRPSELLLNERKKRYKLSDVSKIKQLLNISNAEYPINADNAYKMFQKANSMKKSNEDISEFYVSYIFARNMMTSNVLVTLFCFIGTLFSFHNISLWAITVVFLVINILFTYRWRQKSIYYSKKVFNSIINNT